MNIKIRIIFGVQLLCFVVILGRAFYIQLIKSTDWIQYAESQFLRVYESYPTRGQIYDRNMSPLAINVRYFSLAFVPETKQKTVDLLRKLRKIIPELNTKKIYAELKNRTKFSWITREIKLSDNQLIEIKKLTRIIVEEKYGRIYPNKELMGQILGFVGTDNEGLAGLEFYFQKHLKGDPQITRYFRDAKGRPIKYQTFTAQNTKNNDLVVSLDKEIQAVAEEKIKETAEHFNADAVGVGVMDAETGEILAMANYPSMDPNEYSKFSLRSRKLSYVTDSFEPGSTMKTFTIVSGLEHKTINESSSYYCEKGKLKVQNHYITEADSNKVFEWLSVSDILKYSSNIGITKVAFDIGEKNLKSTLGKFHFGSKLGIEYSGEAKGIFQKEKKYSPLTLSNVSFGHGISTSPLQILSAYAILANDGKFVAPTFIKREKGELVSENVVDISITNQVKKMLLRAVEEGTGSNAKLDHFQIAGKTSTAQRVDPHGRGYQGYISGFAGFPINTQRKIVAYAYVDNPKQNGYYGNLAAAPIVHHLFRHILYKEKEFNGKLLSSGTQVFDQINSRQSAIQNDHLVPNLVGLDRLSIQKISKIRNLRVQIIGNGVVASQVPISGTPIEEDSQITVYLKIPKYED